MCICFFGLNLRPGLQFLLCFNRDEFLGRPTRHAHFWPDQSHILAGRDLAAGGTWLGISVTGRLCFLTNLRAHDPDPDQAAASGVVHHSRGELTTGFLNSELSPLAFCKDLQPESYAGFNLVCVDLARMETAYTHNLHHAAVSNPAAGGSEDQEQQQQQCATCKPSQGGGTWDVPCQLQPGKVYGLSNGTLCEWPKVEAGTEYLSELLQQDHLWPRATTTTTNSANSTQQGLLQQDHLWPPATTTSTQQGQQEPNRGAGGEDEDETDHAHDLPWDELFHVLLGDSQRDESIRPRSPAPGQVLAEEQLSAEEHLGYVTSSRFVRAVSSKHGLYGTRSQTVVAVWEDGVVQLREHYLVPEAGPNPDTAAHAGKAPAPGSSQGCAVDPEADRGDGGGSSSAGHMGMRRALAVPGPGWTWQATHHTFRIKLPDLH